MRSRLVSVVLLALLSLATPAAQAADYILRQREANAPAPVRAAQAGPGLADKIDPLTNTLVVPRFEVDTTSGTGTTTLFALRNTTDNLVDVDIFYASTSGGTLRHDDVVLGPRETLTRNVRDVSGLPADPDGFARGYVVAQAPGDVLTGDFLQVDVGNNFATGDRMVRLEDLCIQAETRFLDFGSGTDLTVLISEPQGADPMTDPPSVTFHVFGEDGAVFSTIDLFTTNNSVVLSTDDLMLPVDFGTIVADFRNASGGLLIAEYSAEGKFSVGMNSACLEQLP